MEERQFDRERCGDHLASSLRPLQRSGRSPQLLVSVRDAAEATIALAAGVDIVDLKEPTAGPLAPASPAVWRDVAERCQEMGSNVPLSAALGEPAEAVRIAIELPPAFAFAKMGPSGCRTPDQLGKRWETVRQRLPAATTLVAVAYADHEAARCLDPGQVIRLAASLGLRHFLVDTFTKDGRSILLTLPPPSLRELVGAAQSEGLWVAVAGSLTLAEAARILAEGIYPACFGVRGDVCRTGRESEICAEKLGLWRQQLCPASLTGTCLPDWKAPL